MKQMYRGVRSLVTGHLAEQFGVLGLEQGRVDADLTGCGMTATERTAETSTGFDLNSVGQIAGAPDCGPFLEPAFDARDVHGWLSDDGFSFVRDDQDGRYA